MVIDLGQFTTKIGWAGQNTPSLTFFTITGESKYSQIAGYEDSKQDFVGNEVMDSLGLYKLTYPIVNSDVADWGHLKSIIDYIFYNLHVDPTSVHVLFSINPNMSKSTQERFFKIFLEDYNCRAYYPVRDSLLTMYSGGFETGLVVDMGASGIRITPIYEGFIIDNAITYCEVGGSLIDEYMIKLAGEAGFSATTSSQKQIVRGIKEKGCFVSINYNVDRKITNGFKKEFSLPDGNILELGTERFLAPELLFKPELFNREGDSLQKAIIDSILLCDIDIRKKLLNTIFLTGGTSQIPNLQLRLQKELRVELSRRGKVPQGIRIIAANNRVFSNWVGGSILSNLPDFQNSWVLRQQYYEDGIPEDLIYLR